MGHRHKCYPHLLIALAFTARTFPSFNPKTDEFFGYNPVHYRTGSPGVPAIRLSFSGHVGNVPDKTTILFSKCI